MKFDLQGKLVVELETPPSYDPHPTSCPACGRELGPDDVTEVTNETIYVQCTCGHSWEEPNDG